MIFGHFGLAGAVRGHWTRSSLWWLLPASIAPDLWDALMAAMGICSPYGLYSHTVPAVVVLAALVGGAAYLARAGRGPWREALPTALACMLVVLLHPVLDLVTGRKLFWPGAEFRGLGLYERPLIDFLLECSLVVGGWLWLRRSATAPRWATAPVTVCGILLLQAAMDMIAAPNRHHLKPSACDAVAAPPPRASLVPPRRVPHGSSTLSGTGAELRVE